MAAGGTRRLAHVGMATITFEGRVKYTDGRSYTVNFSFDFIDFVARKAD